MVSASRDVLRIDLSLVQCAGIDFWSDKSGYFGSIFHLPLASYERQRLRETIYSGRWQRAAYWRSDNAL